MSATLVDVRHERQLTAAVAVAAGAIHQLPDGRAGVYQGLKGCDAGELAAYATEGVFIVPKTANIVILDGGKVFFDHSAGAAQYKTANDRDFYLGTAVGDAAAAATEMRVNLNVLPVYLIDMARDAMDSEIVLTAGTPQLRRIGGTQSLQFSATAEAQKVDILSKDGFAVSANAIVEYVIEVVDGGDDAALDFNIGVASGTHATDADAIVASVFVHLDGNSTAVKAESDDGTTEVNATDTTKVYVLGARHHIWLDMRNQADVQIYFDGVLVLPDSVFNVALATTLYLLAHAEKTANDTPGQIHVDSGRLRIAQQ